MTGHPDRVTRPMVSGDPPIPLDDDRLRDLERRRVQALVVRDLPAVEALHAADDQLITPSGAVPTRDRYLAALRAEPFHAAWDVLGDIAVRRGADLAMVRDEARLTFASGRALRVWHTDAWARGPGGWQAVWSQATEVRTPAAVPIAP